MYYHFSYLDECQTYSLLLIAVMVHNLLWFIGSIIGFKAINSRSAVSILRFFFIMVFLFLSRIGVYVALYVTMGEVSIDKYYCDAVYEGGLYIMEAIIEGVFFLIMLPMIFAIRNYVQGSIIFFYFMLVFLYFFYFFSSMGERSRSGIQLRK